MTDTVSDDITRIKNASLLKKQSVAVKSSKLVNEITEILKNEGYIEGYRVDNASFTNIFLRYDHLGNSVFRIFKRVSRSRLRIYKAANKLVMPYNGLGLEIISTSRGLMTTSDAKRKNLGGEVICQIF